MSYLLVKVLAVATYDEISRVYLADSTSTDPLFAIDLDRDTALEVRDKFLYSQYQKTPELKEIDRDMRVIMSRAILLNKGGGHYVVQLHRKNRPEQPIQEITVEHGIDLNLRFAIPLYIAAEQVEQVPINRAELDYEKSESLVQHGHSRYIDYDAFSVAFLEGLFDAITQTEDYETMEKIRNAIDRKQS